MGGVSPPHPALSPNTDNVLGEREKLWQLLTQGAALGYHLTPRWGSIRKSSFLPLHIGPNSRKPSNLERLVFVLQLIQLVIDAARRQ